jgi:hypothetical protein
LFPNNRRDLKDFQTTNNMHGKKDLFGETGHEVSQDPKTPLSMNAKLTKMSE